MKKIINIILGKRGDMDSPTNSAKSPLTPRASAASRRKQPRYQISDGTKNSHCQLRFNNGLQTHLADLSFRGAFVKSENQQECPLPHLPTEVELDFFGLHIKVSATIIEKRKFGWAVLFDHEDDAFIVGISKIITLLSLGSSCIEIAPMGHNGPGFAKGVNRRRYLGDGPTDLIVDRDSSSNDLLFGMVTIRNGATYGSVIYENGNVITKKNIDGDGVGARMAQTPQVDIELVRIASVICSGMKNQDGAIVANILGDWLSNQDTHRN